MIDRLTHIRDNWQEKGNGPRGRDVDFLLAWAEAGWKPRGFRSDLRRMETDEEWAERLCLPATESAQPEEERS